MRKTLSTILAIAVAALPALAQEPKWTEPELKKWIKKYADVEKKVMVPMRDGVRLATDVYKPKDQEGPFPTIFVRTPYNFNDGPKLEDVHDALERGYVFVQQNERGRYFSDGEWEILGFPRTDGYDALTWIAEQEWSNGKVGTIGCSSSAEWQMALAAMNHPAHAAMIPKAPGAGIGRVGEFWEQGNWYRGGAEQLLFLSWLYGVQNTQRPRLPADLSHEDLVRLSKYYDLAPDMPEVDWKKKLYHLPVGDIMEEVEGPKGIYKEFIARKPNDPAWFEGGLWHDDEDVGVPALWMFSWYDVSIGPNVALFNHVRENATDPEVRENQHMIIAPTEHCRFGTDKSVVGERDMGAIDFPYEEQTYAFFDHWLKGEENAFPEETPRVQYFAMGTNEWREASAWPPEGAERRTFYLQSEKGANSLFGDGRLTDGAPAEKGADHFTYDPTVPVPSVGGNVCCTGGAIESGSRDQRQVEARQDVLVYSTEPLAEPFDATGQVDVYLYVSSDARDTDFTVKLVDVHPDGTAYNLEDTIQRVRYREGYDKEVFLEEGKVYEVRVSPMTTSNVFQEGHRIRVEVSSSNFPRFTRNLNTGGPNHDESEPLVAHNSVHYGPGQASRIVFTVLP